MTAMKGLYHKDNKDKYRQYIHFSQSFKPTDKLTYNQAHEIGVRLSSYFEDYQVLVTTHTDTNHKHNHFVINPISIKNGNMIQITPQVLQQVKDMSDTLCREYGLSVIKHTKDTKYNSHISKNEYHVAVKMESWKYQLITTIDNTLEISNTKWDFIQNMNKQGYNVNWKIDRKYITYTTPDGKKCRDNKLHDKKYLKERMDLEFNKRQTKDIIPKQSKTRKDTNRDNRLTKPNTKYDKKTNYTDRENNRTRGNNVQHGIYSQTDGLQYKEHEYDKSKKYEGTQRQENKTKTISHSSHWSHRWHYLIFYSLYHINNEPKRYYKTRKRMPEKGSQAYKEYIKKLVENRGTIKWDNEDEYER